MSRFSVRDVPLISRAVRERWPISTEARKDAIKLLQSVVSGSVDAPVETQIRACNTLGTFDRLNLKHEELFTPKVDIELQLSTMTLEELQAHIAELDKLTSNPEKSLHEQEMTALKVLAGEQSPGADCSPRGEEPIGAPTPLTGEIRVR